MAAEAVGNLYTTLNLNTGGFDSGIDSATRRLREFGKVDFSKGLKAGLGEVEGALSGAASQAGVLGGILGSLGIVGTAAAAAIAVAFTGAKDAMAFGDEISDTANKLKVTTDYLQEMRWAAREFGVEFEDADAAIEGFSKTLGAAQSGLSAKAVKPFAALGLDPKTLGDTEHALSVVADKIAGLGSAAEQAAVAEKLGLTPILPALREGSKAINDMRVSAHQWGAVMDADLIQRAADAQGEYDRLTYQLDVEFKSAMIDAIPLVEQLTLLMLGGAKAAGALAKEVGKAGKAWQGFTQWSENLGKAQFAARMEKLGADPISKGGVSAGSMQAMFGKPEPKPQGRLIDTGEADRKAAEAQRKAAEAERERKAALKALSDAMHEAEQRSADYAARLLDDIATMGMSSDQVRRYRTEQEAAAAPTEALAGLIKMLGIQYEAQVKVGREAADVQKEVNRQQSDSITTFDEATRGQIHFSTQLEIVAADMEDAGRQARELRFDIEDIAGAINNNDWTSALAGLVKVLGTVDVALGKNATSLQKMQALAGVGMGVGSLVGGTAGAGISGAASGALGGFSLVSSLAAAGTVIPGIGNVAGAAIGAGIGLIGSLFGSSKAKKRQRQQEAAQRAAEEAQRQQQIDDARYSLQLSLLQAQGKETEALALSRQRELDSLSKLDPSLVELQQQLYAAQDASDAAAKALAHVTQVQSRRSDLEDQIDKLTLTSSQLLAKQRAKERDEVVALDPALGDLIDRLFGLQDAATASTDAVAAQEQASAAWAEQQRLSAYLTDQTTKALEAQAAAAQAVSDVFGVAIKNSEDLEKSLRSFAESLGLADEATAAASYAQAKAAFVSSRGADQQISERFLSASAALNGDSLAYQLDRALVRSATLGVANQQAGARDGIASLFRGLEAQGLLPGSSVSIAPPPNLAASDITASLAGASSAGVIVAGNDNGVAALAGEIRALNGKVDQLTAETARGADASEDARDQLRSRTLSVEVVN